MLFGRTIHQTNFLYGRYIAVQLEWHILPATYAHVDDMIAIYAGPDGLHFGGSGLTLRRIRYHSSSKFKVLHQSPTAHTNSILSQEEFKHITQDSLQSSGYQTMVRCCFQACLSDSKAVAISLFSMPAPAKTFSTKICFASQKILVSI